MSTIVDEVNLSESYKQKAKKFKWKFTKVYQDQQATKFYLSKFVYGEGGKKCMMKCKIWLNVEGGGRYIVIAKTQFPYQTLKNDNVHCGKT